MISRLILSSFYERIKPFYSTIFQVSCPANPFSSLDGIHPERLRYVLDAQNITVKVHDGVVTLEGQAHSWKEKDEAREYAWTAPGVSSVENNIVVKF